MATLTIPDSPFYISGTDIARAELLGIDHASCQEILRFFNKYDVKEVTLHSGARFYIDPETLSITFRLGG